MNDDWPISSTARRNAACRAACEGIPTEALEDNAVADMLEALREVVSDLFLQIESRHGPKAASQYPSIVAARAEIARATGEKP